MISFTARCLKVFFRDKSAVFFSLLASFIIIGLYVLFLGDVWSSNFTNIGNSRELMDNWIMAGLLAVTSVTTTMGAFGTMIYDKTHKIIKDFYSSPLRRSSIAGGYIFSSFVIGLIMSLIMLCLAQGYIVLEGGSFIRWNSLLSTLGLILLSTFTNTSIVFFIVTFFSSENAFSTASTIAGTLIGFLTGIYLPIGVLPESIQWVIKLFPPSHSAMLLRQVMMGDIMTQSFAEIPAEYALEFKEVMGVIFSYGGKIITPFTSILILLATGVAFYGLAVLNISRKKK